MTQIQTPSTMRATNSSRNRGIALLRWFLVCLALLAIVGLVLAWVLRSLPHIALAQIGELTNTRIDVESVNVGVNGSVLIKNLVIRPEKEQQYDDAILKAETVYARFGIGSILLLGPRLAEIRVHDFVLDAQYDLDTGRWNVAAVAIRVPGEGSGAIPVVKLTGGKLRYSKVSNGQAKVAASVPIHATFGPDETTRTGYQFKIRTARLAGGYGTSKLEGSWQPGKITLAGGISSEDIPSLERALSIYVLAAELDYDQERNYSLKLRIKDLQTTHSPEADTFVLARPAFLEESGLFTALQRFSERYRPAGTVDIEIEQATGNLDRLGDSKVDGKIYCKDVSICDRAFPYAVEHLTGQIDFTESTVTLNPLAGKHGDVNLTIEGLVKGLGPDREYQIHVTSSNMALDSDLYDALSPEQKKWWAAFSPSGRAAIDYRLSRRSPVSPRPVAGAKNRGKKIGLTVELLDAEATYREFPYPLKNLSGKLFYNRQSLIVSDVVSQMGSPREIGRTAAISPGERRITFNGSVTGLDAAGPVCYLSIKANDIPLDSTLAGALPQGQRDFYRRFDMTGLADADVRVFTPGFSPRLSAGVPRPVAGAKNRDPNSRSFLADVTLRQASLKVGKAPLVVSDITAQAVVTPDSINLKSFNGRHGEGAISVTGGISLTGQAEPSRYHLIVDANQIPVSSDLLALLPPPAKKIFSELSPAGRIDVAANLTKAAGDDVGRYEITVDCLSDSMNIKQFAYPLEDVTGRLRITNDRVVLENLAATPAGDVPPADGGGRIELSGQANLDEMAFGQGSFKLLARDIRLDDRLATALSDRGLVPSHASLLPAGRFDLDTDHVRIFSTDEGSRCVDLAGTVRLKQCRFDLAGIQAELIALLDTKVLYQIGSGFAEGQVSVLADSLRIKGKSVSNLKAQMGYQPDRGRWRAENLIADCHGGRMIGMLEFKRPDRETLEYALQVGFHRVDLKRFLADAKTDASSGSAHTSGNLSGALSIVARMGDRPSRIGRCRLAIRDMEVGKLSPLAKLLYVVNLTEPKDFAFERMVVDSYIKRNRLLFETFDLSGQAVAFSGSGSMDLDTDDVNLILTARGKRLAAAQPSVMQSLAEGLGQAVVRIEVTGNVHDPKVTTRTLPVIEDSLRLLGERR